MKYSKDDIQKAMFMQVFEQNSKEINKSIKKKSITYEAILKEILTNDGQFVDVPIDGSDPNIVVPSFVQRQMALVEALSKIKPPKLAAVLGKEVTYRDSHGKIQTKSILDRILALNSSWTSSTLGWAGELSLGLAIAKAEIKGVKGILEKSGLKLTGTEKAVGILNGLEDATAPRTVKKEDFSVTLEESGGVHLRAGFSIKETSKYNRDYAGKVDIKVHSGGNIQQALEQTGLLNESGGSELLYDLKNTALGLSTRQKVGLKNEKRRRQEGAQTFTIADIDARWRDQLDLIAAAMSVYALSGTGAEGSRAMFLVWNGNIISMRKILEAIASNKDAFMKANSPRQKLTAMNKSSKGGGYFYESERKYLNRRDALVRSDKINSANILQEAKISFTLNLNLAKFK